MQTENLGNKAALKQSHKKIKQLKKELLRKKKALAEAGAGNKLMCYYRRSDGAD